MNDGIQVVEGYAVAAEEKEALLAKKEALAVADYMEAKEKADEAERKLQILRAAKAELLSACEQPEPGFAGPVNEVQQAHWDEWYNKCRSSHGTYKLQGFKDGSDAGHYRYKRRPNETFSLSWTRKGLLSDAVTRKASKERCSETRDAGPSKAKEIKWTTIQTLNPVSGDIDDLAHAPPAHEPPAHEPPAHEVAVNEDVDATIESTKKRKRAMKEEVPCQRPVDPNKTPWGTVDNPLVNCQGQTFAIKGGAGAIDTRCYYCTSCKHENGQPFQFAVNCLKKRYTCMVCNNMKDDCECVLFKPYGLEPKLCKRSLDKSNPIRIVKCSVCGMAPKGTACICNRKKSGGKSKDLEDSKAEESSPPQQPPLQQPPLQQPPTMGGGKGGGKRGVKPGVKPGFKQARVIPDASLQTSAEQQKSAARMQKLQSTVLSHGIDPSILNAWQTITTTRNNGKYEGQLDTFIYNSHGHKFRSVNEAIYWLGSNDNH
jgi:transcription elongation factor Elf1